METRPGDLARLSWPLLVGLLVPAAWAGEVPREGALSVYAGRLTDSEWYSSLTPGVDLIDSSLLALAWSRTLLRADTRPWSIEWEGQAVKHFGDQDHWEFNLLLGGRWHRFPWSDTVATSLAFGVGPSYATELPKAEVARHGDSEQWLAYWYLELTLGPPRSDWSGILRLHHRSTAFGLFGDTGGSNALTVGFRYAF